MTITEQLSECQVRDRAERAGLRLHKSHSRNVNDPQFGCFYISDAVGNYVVYGGWPLTYSATLEDCADYVNEALAD